MDYFAFIGGIGTTELLLILAVVLLLFGSKKLPELARAAGQSVNELRKGVKGDKPQPAAVAVADDGTEREVSTARRNARV